MKGKLYKQMCLHNGNDVKISAKNNDDVDKKFNSITSRTRQQQSKVVVE